MAPLITPAFTRYLAFVVLVWTEITLLACCWQVFGPDLKNWWQACRQTVALRLRGLWAVEPVQTEENPNV